MISKNEIAWFHEIIQPVSDVKGVFQKSGRVIEKPLKMKRHNFIKPAFLFQILGGVSDLWLAFYM